MDLMCELTVGSGAGPCSISTFHSAIYPNSTLLVSCTWNTSPYIYSVHIYSACIALCLWLVHFAPLPSRPSLGTNPPITSSVHSSIHPLPHQLITLSLHLSLHLLPHPLIPASLLSLHPFIQPWLDSAQLVPEEKRWSQDWVGPSRY